MMDGTCGNCRYWMPTQGDIGICRRYPPGQFMVGAAQPAIVNPANPPAPQPIFATNFPALHRQGWCGEHQPKLDS